MRKQKELTIRKCIVSGKLFNKNELIRFVVDHQKRLIPDLDQKLPGTSYWLKADQLTLQSSQKKSSFFLA